MNFVLRLRAVWLVLLCVLFVADGCRKEQNSSTTASTEPSTQPNRELNIAAAADLKFALDDLSARFRHSHPDTNVNVTYGSSGNFYSQLSSKAPFDLFLSADTSYPSKLVDQGLAAKDSQFVYAVGRLVIWVPKDSPLDVSTLGMNSLLDSSVRKIAIANPRHAPYGRAAEAALRTHQLWDKLRPRLVLGENIAQTAQFVQSGSADAGVIALSLAVAPQMKEGKYYLIPPADYPTMRQAGVILSYAKNPVAAGEFKQFITGPEGKIVLREYGFGLERE